MLNARSISRTDLVVACACVVVYAILLACISDNVTLMEGDIYRMLFGILNGEVSGARVLDPMHYGTSFSFGYLAFIYHFAGDAALHHPADLIAFINHLGYICAVATLCFLWLAIALAYDSLIATAALVLFAFSPVFIVLGASGHPIVPAYLFLMAGSAAVFAECDGWKRVVCRVLAVALLAAGMSMRADILLALPWVALTHPSAVSLRDYAGKVFKRGLFLVGVFLLFLLVRHFALAHAEVKTALAAHPQTFTDYMQQFFLLHNIAGGGMSGIFACGIAVTLALAIAMLFVLMRGKYSLRHMTLLPLAGPVVIMVLALVFWLPIGVNSRHFITFTLGAALFLPLVMVGQLKWNRTRVLAAVVILAVCNQLAGELLRPVFLRVYHASYLAIPDERRTFTMAPLGFTWDHVRALQARHAVYAKWESTLGDLCENKVVVMMDYDDEEQVMSSLYDSAPTPQASLIDLEGFKRIVVIEKGGKTLVFLAKADVWPADPLERILREPQFSDYKILKDPYSLSTYDRVALPPERAAHTGCRK